MEPSRHDKAMSNVRVGPPIPNRKKFIYLTSIGDFFLIKVITTKIPCTRHGVSLVVFTKLK
jgi:hypothetical protein